MRLSQLADRCGVPATTLRFYEGAGLLPADRSASGYRMYGEEAVERLAFLGAAKHLGLPLEEIGELRAAWEADACADVKADLRPRIAARLDALPAVRAREIAALAASEQQYCPFFDVCLHLDGQDLHLEVRARAEGAELLTGLFGPTA